MAGSGGIAVIFLIAAAVFTKRCENFPAYPALSIIILLLVVVLFVPIVPAYQIWMYHFFKGEVTEEEMIY